MTTSLLALQGAAFGWPGGQRLFSNLDILIDRRRTGLVGRNGVGKSALARVLAGELELVAGRRTCTGRVHYVPQHVACPVGATVAAVAGVQMAIDALGRIEAGSVDPADFALVGDRWDIRQRLVELLAGHGLGHLLPERSAADLSGGERTRLALLGAWLSGPEVLILDEPTNHLDCVRRDELMEELQAWQGALLVVSHDRELLQNMQRIVELSPSGLREYGGNFAFYERTRAQEQTQAVCELEHCKAEQRRGEAAWRLQRENLERRQARGAREGREVNQAAILLGRRRQQGQTSASRKQRGFNGGREARMREVRMAAARVREDQETVLLAPAPSCGTRQRVAMLDRVHLPFGSAAAEAIDLTLMSGQRIGVTGANGCGKSTLLKLLAGVASPAAGRCEVYVPVVFLDQQLRLPDSDASALALLLAANPTMSEVDMRTRLALIGLSGEAALRPVLQLSGGERLKTALACIVYAEIPARLLLLDEPTNHLDLHAIDALEQMLLQYRGTLVVVSHDRAFLGRLALDGRIELASGGCRLFLEGEP